MRRLVGSTGQGRQILPGCTSPTSPASYHHSALSAAESALSST